jgi:hypothetical protein
MWAMGLGHDFLLVLLVLIGSRLRASDRVNYTPIRAAVWKADPGPAQLCSDPSGRTSFSSLPPILPVRLGLSIDAGS